MEHVNITPIINALIALLAAIITAYIAPAIRKRLNAVTTEQERSTFYNDVAILVQAAQQLAEANGWSGADKLQKVTEWAQEQGIDTSSQSFRIAVESIVFSLKQALPEITEETTTTE